MKKNLIPLMLLLTCSFFSFQSCKKDKNEESATLQVRMTDAPTVAEEVNVDIRHVMVKYSDDPNDSTKNWVDFNTTTGVYNLLNFQNGADIMIATGTLPVKRVKEIRLILGTNNSIKVGGIVYPLTIPSGAESGLKIKLSKDLNSDLNVVVIDFDAAASVQQTGATTYVLRPVIKIK